MSLRLSDGTVISNVTEPRQGTRHRIFFGVDESSGREVAVKVELLAGALEPERRALEWLGAHDGPSPALRAATTLVSADGPALSCLVCDRSHGEHPESAAGWHRLGRALGRLPEIPWQGSGLEVQDHRTFLALHESRVGDLGRAGPSNPFSFFAAPLVLTHGDPGPGNFLDDGAAGTLIDWEDALVAPRGLDLGRAVFIALSGSGPEGYAARDHAARAQAVAAGFSEGTGDSSPTGEELTWWVVVAGIQFAHRRLEREGEPGVLPWREAIAALDAALDEEPFPWLREGSR